MKPETKFRNSKVLPFLKSLKNSVHFPIQQVAITGTPDFFCCSNGVFIALELKSTLGKLSALQAYQMRRVIDCGGVSLVATPENWDEVKQILLAADEREK